MRLIEQVLEEGCVVLVAMVTGELQVFLDGAPGSHTEFVSAQVGGVSREEGGSLGDVALEAAGGHGAVVEWDLHSCRESSVFGAAAEVVAEPLFCRRAICIAHVITPLSCWAPPYDPDPGVRSRSCPDSRPGQAATRLKVKMLRPLL